MKTKIKVYDDAELTLLVQITEEESQNYFHKPITHFIILKIIRGTFRHFEGLQKEAERHNQNKSWHASSKLLKSPTKQQQQEGEALMKEFMAHLL